MKIAKNHRFILLLPILIIGTVLLATLANSQSVHAQASCQHVTNSAELETCVDNNPITKDIATIINVLSAGVGLIITAMIIVGGIQYMTAGDNPQGVSAAKQRITNALIALVAFLLTYAFLQWVVPGGVFNK